MYHVELRKFPHSFWAFNLSEQELRGMILDAWVQGAPLQAGERWWTPRETRLTVLEGPRLGVQDTSMGRGWRNAARRGEDVTERVLAAARQAGASAAGTAPSTGALGVLGQAGGSAGAQMDESLALGVLQLLGEDPLVLLRAWRAARERHPERTPSECLALAERAVRA